MNEEVLLQMRSVIMETAKRISKNFNVFEIDTSKKGYNKNPKKSCEDAASKILDWIEDDLKEEILHMPKDKIIGKFSNSKYLDGIETEKLVKEFENIGDFAARADIESDLTKVQALPVVIVRNKSGDILQLRRRERHSDNALHEKLVIWAGGHTRKEDKHDGKTITNCAVRELEEELRLCIDPKDLDLLGAVYSDSSEGTSKHIAIVYEWRAETDDVAVALSNAEFFERRGNSLSGSFVSPDSLLDMIDEKKLTEEWSEQIIRNLLPATAKNATPSLFD